MMNTKCLDKIIKMNGKIYKVIRLRQFNNFKGELVPSCDAQWLYKGKWHNVKCEQILINIRKLIG